MSEASAGVQCRDSADRARPTRRELVALALLAVVLAGSLCFVLATRRIPDSADQAVVGLMALDILHGKGHPVFYYGSAYAGSLEAHYLAGVFGVVGASPGTYRGAMTLLLLVFVCSVWALTRRLFGPRAAFFGALYLVVPPFFFLYKTLTSDGHYASAQVIALGILAAALWQHDRKERRSLLPSMAFGFVCGLGIWVTPVSPPVSAAALVWLLACGGLKPLLWRVPSVAFGALLGSCPWWIWNSRHGWASLSSPDMGLVDVSGLLRNLGGVARSSLAILTGAGQLFMVPPSGVLFPGAWPIAGILLLVVLLPLAGREMRKDSRVILFVLTGAFVLLAGAASRRFVAFEPRFFVTLYAVIPPLVGASLARAPSRRRTGTVAAVALFGVLAINAGSLVAARTHEVVQQEREVTGRLDELLSALAVRGIDRVYASYWTAYRIAFESRQSILATPLRSDDVVRLDGYERAVDEARDPAFVLLPPTAPCFERYLVEKGVPYRTVTVGSFGVFTGLSSGTLSIIRGLHTIPLPSAGHKESFVLLRHPATMAAGTEAEVALEVRNESPCVWTPAVHLGHSWQRTDVPSAPVEEPKQLSLSRVQPGRSFRAVFPIRAPIEPGRWTVRYDLVQGKLTWFGDDGGAPVVVPVSVTASHN